MGDEHIDHLFVGYNLEINGNCYDIVRINELDEEVYIADEKGNYDNAYSVQFCMDQIM